MARIWINGKRPEQMEYTYNDIVEFINAVGGRAEFENPNSQVKLAINRLIENNQLVTAENVKYLAQQWHQEETLRTQAAQNRLYTSSEMDGI